MFRKKRIKKKEKFKKKDFDKQDQMKKQNQGSFTGHTDLYCVMTGTREINIENYGSLGSFTEEEIILHGKKNQVTIRGHHLLIEYFTDVDMKITGQIESVLF